MGKLTSEVFNESCCDGGECSAGGKSAQSCGCDEGAKHSCEQHLYMGGVWNVGLNQKTEWKPQWQQTVALDLTTASPVPLGIGGAPTRARSFPTGSLERKQHPVASGVMDYFPDALVAVAHVSWQGNEQHNPGQPLHWARDKSADEADALIRHFLERGLLDTDGMRHSAKMAWRALALLQKEIEAEQ